MNFENNDDKSMCEAMGWGLADMIQHLENCIKTTVSLQGLAESGQKHADEYKLGIGNLAEPFIKKIARMEESIAFYKAQL